MKKTKIFFSFVVLTLQYLFWIIPIQNPAGVDQLNDTATSSSNVTIVSHLVTFAPVIGLIILYLIWKNELRTFVENKTK